MTKNTNSKLEHSVKLVQAVGNLLANLAPLGYSATLIGGMALMVLGSRRVTLDFDFLISEKARDQKEFIRVFYKHGFELVSKTSDQGDVMGTIDNREVASARLALDRPPSAFFFNHDLNLRIDFLFDFPLLAKDVYARSSAKIIQSYEFHIASREDLIAMKELALKERKFAGDAQDLEFLKSMRNRT